MRSAATLAACLRAQGLEVTYRAPMERRDTGIGGPELLEITVVGGTAAILAADAIKAAVKRGVDKFHERYPGLEVSTEGEPDPSAEK